MLSTAIFVYAATSPVNGYFGGSLYARQGGNLLFNSVLFGEGIFSSELLRLEWKLVLLYRNPVC